MFFISKTREFNNRLNKKLFNCGEYILSYQNQVKRVIGKKKRVISLGSGRQNPVTKNQFPDYEGSHICMDLDYPSLRMSSANLRVVGDGYRMPFSKDSIDVILMSHLLEHIEEPTQLFLEVKRILKPEGKVIFTAPHKYSYIAFLAMMTPLSFHRWIAKLMGNTLADTDHWPTYYRFNDRKTVMKISNRLGFKIDYFQGYIGEPCYSSVLPLLHVLFIIMHKVLEFVDTKRRFAISLVGVLSKS